MLTVVNSTSRSRVLEAAAEVLQEQGLAAVTMRAVARKAGVTATALYRHVPHKEALIELLRARGAERFEASLPAGTGTDSAETRLRAALDAVPDFAVRYPGFFDLLFLGDGLPGAPPARTGPAFQRIVTLVRECMRDGVLREDDPIAVATALTAHATGLVMLYRGGGLGEGAGFPRLCRESTRRVLQGLT